MPTTDFSMLPQWKCHKIVRAAKIHSVGQPTVTVLIDGVVSELINVPEIFARSAPSPGDYLVVYDDDYVSWSPAKAFEEGYKLLPAGWHGHSEDGEQGGEIRYGAILSEVVGDRRIYAMFEIDEQDAHDLLVQRAVLALPPNTRFEIRSKIPENYGRTKGMAWYRTAQMDAAETWGVDRPQTPPLLEGAYILRAQLVTPPSSDDPDHPIEKRAAALWREDHPGMSVFDCDHATKEEYRRLAREEMGL